LKEQIKAVTEQINISAKKIEEMTKRHGNQMRRESLIQHIERQKQKQEQYECELQKFFEKNSSPISINTK
jgi:hypothetical protein